MTITNAATNYTWNSNNSGTNLVIFTDGDGNPCEYDLNDSGPAGLYLNNAGVKAGNPGVTLTNVDFYNNEGELYVGRLFASNHCLHCHQRCGDGKDQHCRWQLDYGYYVDNTSEPPSRQSPLRM